MEPTISPEIHVNYLSECNNNFYLHTKTLASTKKYVLHLLDVISGMCNVIKRYGVHKAVYENALKKKNWRPELLYLLSCSKLIDLNNYFRRIESNELVCEDLCKDLLFLFRKRLNDTFYNEVKSELAVSILKYTGDPEHNQYFLQCFAQHFYNYVKSHQLEEENGSVPFLLSLSDETSDNGFFFPLLLSLIFTDQGSLLMDAIKSGSYMKPNNNNTLSLLYDKVCAKTINATEILRKFIFQSNMDTNINWSNIGQFLLAIIKDNKYGEIKKLILELIEMGLENSDPHLLYSSLILGRICSLETKTYMQWFSSTFSAESTRPLNTDRKARFFLKCLSDIVYYEEVGHLRAHVNKVPFVPSTCQGDLSEYLQVAKSCLVSMNESIEVGFFEGVVGVKTVDNDVKCLVEGFEKKKKVPAGFLASLQFRRQYFERELLPKLLIGCPGCNSTHHNVIKELHSLGKISNAIFAKHREECKL